MKTMVFISMLVSAGLVWGQDMKEFYMNQRGDRFNKTQAVKTMLLEPDSFVYRCYQVELTDKLTLKKKK